jgi:O-methyltransferase domain
MHTGSRLLVAERVLPEVAGPDHASSLLLDMHMLVVTGGRERTLGQFRELLDAAGFTLTGCTGPLPPFGYHVLEAEPRD